MFSFFKINKRFEENIEGDENISLDTCRRFIQKGFSAENEIGDAVVAGGIGVSKNTGLLSGCRFGYKVTVPTTRVLQVTRSIVNWGCRWFLSSANGGLQDTSDALGELVHRKFVRSSLHLPYFDCTFFGGAIGAGLVINDGVGRKNVGLMVLSFDSTDGPSLGFIANGKTKIFSLEELKRYFRQEQPHDQNPNVVEENPAYGPHL